MQPVNVGTLAPHGETFMPEWIKPDNYSDRTGSYIIMISAQNGTVVEELWFRPAKIGMGWAYKFTVSRVPPNRPSSRGYNIFRGKSIVKIVDWTEPIPPE
jgi:hypothetical protein